MKLKLIEKIKEASDVYSFIFEPSEPMSWRAGQYLRYHIPDSETDERGEWRFFTIASAPFEKDIWLTTRFSDEGSTFKKGLQKLKVGEEVEASGPGGNFIVEELGLSYVFIAGGIGITPFRAILREMDYQKKLANVILLYANRSKEIIFKDALDNLAERNPDLKVIYIIDPDRIDEGTIRVVISDIKIPIFYLSGPKVMVESLKGGLESMGVTDEKIKTDFFPGYNEY